MLPFATVISALEVKQPWHSPLMEWGWPHPVNIVAARTYMWERPPHVDAD